MNDCEHKEVVYTVTHRVAMYHIRGYGEEAAEVIKRIVPKTGRCADCNVRVPLAPRGIRGHEIVN